MKTFDQYDYLSGIVTIKCDGPFDWKDNAVLPFWVAPNDERWGKQLSRVLYHESLHFWQFLSSPYLIRIVGRLWNQLLHYEATGELSLEDSLWQDQETRSSKAFSNYELVESWARYWDVHTRNPIEIISEEAIEANGASLDHKGYYSYQAYDIVMTKGPNCQLYARPYRWLLATCDGNSLLANVLFPLITNAAFSTLNPAGFFHEAIEIALKSRKIRDGIREYADKAINLTWLKSWDTVLTEAVAPFVEQQDETLVPFQKAGYQAIEDGSLSSHPIFRQYVRKADGSNFKLWFQYFHDTSGDETPSFLEYSEWINHVAKKMPIYGVYGMPGQPFYRSTLGTLVPPPRIEFGNYSWNAPRILQIDISGNNRHRAQDEETFEQDYGEMIPRIKRFRYALEAVKLGLPPTAFDEES
jgi:hypothetical protein